MSYSMRLFVSTCHRLCSGGPRTFICLLPRRVSEMTMTIVSYGASILKTFTPLHLWNRQASTCSTALICKRSCGRE